MTFSVAMDIKEGAEGVCGVVIVYWYRIDYSYGTTNVFIGGLFDGRMGRSVGWLFGWLLFGSVDFGWFGGYLSVAAVVTCYVENVSECSFADSECGKNTNYETKKAAAAAELCKIGMSLENSRKRMQ